MTNKNLEVGQLARTFVSEVYDYWNGTDVAASERYTYGETDESRREFMACCLIYLKDMIIAKRLPQSAAQINMFQEMRWTDGVLELAVAGLLTNEYQYTSLFLTLTREIEQGARDPRDLLRASRSQFASE